MFSAWLEGQMLERGLPGVAVGVVADQELVWAAGLRRMPDNTRAINRFIDARGMAAATGVTSTVEDMARFASAQFRKGPRGGAQILSTGSMREMHRVRVLENNWTQHSSWSRFAGLYRGRGGDSRVVELNRRLVLIASNSANLDNPVQLEPVGNGLFRYVASVGGGPVGEIVRFVEENGRVTRMITGDSYVERVQP